MPRKGKKGNKGKEEKASIFSETSSLAQANLDAMAATSSSLSTSSSAPGLMNRLKEHFTKEPALPEHLATQFESHTSLKHSQIAFDPVTRTAMDMKTKIPKVYKKTDPIVFILADAAMPGAFKPAAARLHRYEEAEKHDDILLDFQNNAYIICPSHGDMVKVESLQTDHVDSASMIQQRQLEIINELNSNKKIAADFIAEFHLEDLFVLVETNDQGTVNTNYQGTLYFYERYYNDNLWTICQSCNLHKTDKDPLEWFKANENFGKAFITHLESLGMNDNGFILTADNKGLADIALTWYKEKHGGLIETTKKLHKKIIFVIQHNLHKAALAIGNDNKLKAEAHSARAALTTHIASTAAGIDLGYRMPGESPPESPGSNLSTSDEDKEIINTTAAVINKVVSKFEALVPADFIEKGLKRHLRMNYRESVRDTNLDADIPIPLDQAKMLFDKYTREAELHKSLYETYKANAEKYQEIYLKQLAFNPSLEDIEMQASENLRVKKRKHSTDSTSIAESASLSTSSQSSSPSVAGSRLSKAASSTLFQPVHPESHAQATSSSTPQDEPLRVKKPRGSKKK